MAEILSIVLTEYGFLEVERPGRSETLWPGDKTRMGRGALEFHKGAEGAYFVMRLTGSGKLAFPPLTLEEEVPYNIGPKYAHQIVDPRDERDPILRVLRELGVPIGKLRFLKEGQTLSFKLHASDWGFDGSAKAVFTDQETIYCEADGVCEKSSPRLFSPKVVVKVWKNWREGYDYALTDFEWVDQGNADIDKVWVVPGVDPALLREVLTPAVEWVKAGQWYHRDGEDECKQEVEVPETDQYADYDPADDIAAAVASDEPDCDACHHPGPACTSCPVRTTV